jgi:hypothetical protein
MLACARVRRPSRGLLLLLAATLAAPLVAAPRLVDRILAVVDEDPILASEVDQAIGLGLVERRAGESDAVLRRRVLDGLIEQRLRFHEVDRFGLAEVPVEVIEAHFREIRARFADAEAFAARLAELGLDEVAVRQLVARQLMVLRFVEERLGPRIFVGLDEIRVYYERTLAPELRRRGEPVPPIEEVRERIRALLKDERLNEEIGRWSEELRRAADISDHFDAVHAELPPVVLELPRPAGRHSP